MPTSLSPAAIERELHIAASPETVYGFFVDPEKMARWMGRAVQADSRPGGIIRVDYNGFDIMRGEYTVLEPYSRVVFTWGWETLRDSVQPGGSTVEVTFAPEASGTLLRLVHSGLSEADREPHAQGWDMGLAGLVQQAEGAPAPGPAPSLSDGEALASRLNTSLVELRWFLERCPADRWNATVVGDGRPVAVVAHHVVSHLGLVGFAQAVAAGQRAPQADFTGEALEQYNAQHAQQMAKVTRDAVLSELKAEGPKAVEALKGLSPADFARTQSMAFAGGAELSARQIVEGPLLGDIAAHLASMQRSI
jgi:uncharacterized protein YndB with AHSA1/START domain